MNKYLISDELYRELQTLPENILISTNLLLREQWLANPANGEAFMGVLITGGVLRERGLNLPKADDAGKLEAAFLQFCLAMNIPGNALCQ